MASHLLVNVLQQQQHRAEDATEADDDDDGRKNMNFIWREKLAEYARALRNMCVCVLAECVRNVSPSAIVGIFNVVAVVDIAFSFIHHSFRLRFFLIPSSLFSILFCYISFYCVVFIIF